MSLNSISAFAEFHVSALSPRAICAGIARICGTAALLTISSLRVPRNEILDALFEDRRWNFRWIIVCGGVVFGDRCMLFLLGLRFVKLGLRNQVVC